MILKVHNNSTARHKKQNYCSNCFVLISAMRDGSNQLACWQTISLIVAIDHQHLKIFMIDELVSTLLSV